MVTMKPSSYQQTILHAVANTRDNIVVEAVAGSGKSTTLEMICKALPTPSSAILLAFNVSICKELQERFKKKGIGVKVQGINSAGHGMVCKHLGNGVTVDDSKYRDLVREHIRECEIDDRDGEISTSLTAIVRFAQSTLVNPKKRDEIMDMIEHYDLDTVSPAALDYMVKALPVILEAGVDMARTRKIISFSDQLYLPVLWNLRPWQQATVMVDEAQDLSPAQLEIVMKHCMRGGRMIFCGDSRQAIYAFAGSDCNSIQQIIDRTKAKVLPLSICYRCPSSHIELAKAIVPQIEASETAIKGEVGSIRREAFANRVQEGDLVLCRTTAPLVEACFELIGLGMPARIKGRQIGMGLSKLLTKIVKDHGGASLKIEAVPAAIYSYQDKATAALAGQKDADQKTSKINDQVACLIAIFNMGKPTSIDGFHREINDLFSDDRPGITLSTVHRAKGLEEDRVFILKPELMPHPMAKKDWQITQEHNLRYVALTRAKKALFFVE